MTDFKPQLGMLPRPEGLPVLSVPGLPFALPPYPPELHNIELDPDTDLLGNDIYGNCVFVAIERHRRIAAAALGKTVTWLTAQQVINKYTSYTGVKTPPGPGAVIAYALNWVRKDPNGWGGSHLLAFADVPRLESNLRASVSEFQSIVTGENIRAAQEYPSKVWTHTSTPVLGGHATPGGSYNTTSDFLKTWGYIVTVTDSFFQNDIGEMLVLIWDFMWDSLSYDRQVQLVTDFQALTGKTWTGPAPVQPPVPPTPLPEVTMHLLPQQYRIFNKALTSATTVQFAGVGPIPPEATGVVLALRAVSPAARTTVYMNHAVTWDFGSGAYTPNGWPTVTLTALGGILFETSQPITQFVVDVLAYLS